jgi:hypothetical protein
VRRGGIVAAALIAVVMLVALTAPAGVRAVNGLIVAMSESAACHGVGGGNDVIAHSDRDRILTVTLTATGRCHVQGSLYAVIRDQSGAEVARVEDRVNLYLVEGLPYVDQFEWSNWCRSRTDVYMTETGGKYGMGAFGGGGSISSDDFPNCVDSSLPTVLRVVRTPGAIPSAGPPAP